MVIIYPSSRLINVKNDSEVDKSIRGAVRKYNAHITVHVSGRPYNSVSMQCRGVTVQRTPSIDTQPPSVTWRCIFFISVEV